MPTDKRVDVLFTIGESALPVECKGQWNTSLWSAAGNQLDAFYLRDWRVQDVASTWCTGLGPMSIATTG